MNIITVQGKFESPFGKGDCRDQGHVLIRPFDKLMVASVPQEPVKILFLQSPQEELPSHIAGVLLYSVGKRVIFYPGLRDRTAMVTPRSGDVLSKLIHHISIEPDLKDWHATTGDAEHESVGRTRLMEPDLYHLFSMSAQSTSVFEQTPELIEMRVETTESDSKRRVERFRQAMNGAEHQLIKLDKNHEGFLNFDFYLDQREIKLDASYKSWLPPQSEFHAVETPQDDDTCRIHAMELNSLAGKIVVKAAWLRGSLRYEAIFWELNEN